MSQRFAEGIQPSNAEEVLKLSAMIATEEAGEWAPGGDYSQSTTDEDNTAAEDTASDSSLYYNSDTDDDECERFSSACAAGTYHGTKGGGSFFADKTPDMESPNTSGLSDGSPLRYAWGDARYAFKLIRAVLGRSFRAT